MATSSSYWSFGEAVKDELDTISGLALTAYGNLENSDDPGELADELASIKKRLDQVSEQIGPAIPLLKKAASALEGLPSFKAGA